MDKFYGINRAEIVSARYGCEISAESKKISADDIKITEKKGKSGAKTAEESPKNKSASLAWLRYAVCGLILAVCLLGKFMPSAPFDKVSDFIKEELNRDIVRELTDKND